MDKELILRISELLHEASHREESIEIKYILDPEANISNYFKLGGK